MSETLSSGLTLTIPTIGEQNWSTTIRTSCFSVISAHDHTGSGNGVQISTNAIATGAVTKTKTSFPKDTWTPTVTASGSLTISSLNIDIARYTELDNIVFFTTNLRYTLGGVADTIIYISLPTAAAADNNQLGLICAASENGGIVTNGGRWRVDATPRIILFKPGVANWTLGAGAGVSIQGSYHKT